jgi:hypothetical protein
MRRTSARTARPVAESESTGVFDVMMRYRMCVKKEAREMVNRASFQVTDCRPGLWRLATPRHVASPVTRPRATRHEPVCSSSGQPRSKSQNLARRQYSQRGIDPVSAAYGRSAKARLDLCLDTLIFATDTVLFLRVYRLGVRALLCAGM